MGKEVHAFCLEYCGMHSTETGMYRSQRAHVLYRKLRCRGHMFFWVLPPTLQAQHGERMAARTGKDFMTPKNTQSEPVPLSLVTPSSVGKTNLSCSARSVYIQQQV
jgi:hypothetical protein